MPNLKVFVDQAVWDTRADHLIAALAELREILCRHFAVPPAACQVVALPVRGLADQPLANVELAILPRPERTGQVVTDAGLAIQALVAAVLGTPVAVRISQLDAATYVALK